MKFISLFCLSNILFAILINLCGMAYADEWPDWATLEQIEFMEFYESMPEKLPVYFKEGGPIEFYEGKRSYIKRVSGSCDTFMYNFNIFWKSYNYGASSLAFVDPYWQSCKNHGYASLKKKVSDFIAEQKREDDLKRNASAEKYQQRIEAGNISRERNEMSKELIADAMSLRVDIHSLSEGEKALLIGSPCESLNELDLAVETIDVSRKEEIFLRIESSIDSCKDAISRAKLDHSEAVKKSGFSIRAEAILERINNIKKAHQKDEAARRSLEGNLDKKCYAVLKFETSPAAAPIIYDNDNLMECDEFIKGLEKEKRDEVTSPNRVYSPRFQDHGSVSSGKRQDVDRLTSYAVILGRATGCNIDTTKEMQMVGRWMDRIYPPGSEDQRVMLPVFMAGVKQHADAQRAGRSPDGCATVARHFGSITWPR